jgi:hypothetical protein
MMTFSPDSLRTSFAGSFSQSAPRVVTRAPGGSVWIAAAPNESAVVNLVVPQLEAHLAFRLSVPGASAHRYDVTGFPLPPWALYAGAIGWAWAARGYAVPGLDAVVLAEDGIHAGFVWETGLAFAAAWQDLGGWPQPEGGLLGLMAHLGGYFRS